MQNSFLSLMALFIKSGEINAKGVTEKRKTRHLNILVIISIIIYIFYGSIYFILGYNNAVLLNSGIAITLFLPLSFLIPFLNRKGKLRLSRWVMSIVFTGIILSLMLFGQGNYFNAHFFFLAFCSALFTYFPLSQWRDISFFFIINLSLFIVSHLGVFQPYPEAYDVSSAFTLVFSMTNIIVSTLILGGMIVISEYATSHSDHELETLSTTDSLTGLLNRHGFMTRFGEERTRCQRLENFSSLLFFDLNNFKALNDQYGHNVGDLLLQNVAQRIKNSLRNTDIIGRIGGDEFTAIMCAVSDNENNALSQTKATVEKIRQALSQNYILQDENHNIKDNDKIKCSSSIGFAIFHGNSELEDVLKTADQAMYEDKKRK